MSSFIVEGALQLPPTPFLDLNKYSFSEFICNTNILPKRLDIYIEKLFMLASDNRFFITHINC